MATIDDPWAQTIAVARPFHFDMSEDAGFSIPSDAEIFCIVAMILGYGFKTDPVDVGVETLAVRRQPGKPEVNKVHMPLEGAVLFPNLAIGGIGLVKGKNDAMRLWRLSKQSSTWI